MNQTPGALEHRYPDLESGTPASLGEASGDHAALCVARYQNAS